MDKSKRVLTPNEAAKILMVSPITLRQWAQKDKIKSHTTLGGHRRYIYAEVLEFAKKEGITLLDELTNNESKERKMLIVDDDKDFSQLLQDMLSIKYEGWSIDNAHDGFDAGIKVQQNRPDIMLIDLKLPGIQGDEVCRNILSKSDLSSIRIIGMTGYMDDENVEKFLSSGAQAVLEKPINTEKLYALLDA